MKARPASENDHGPPDTAVWHDVECGAYHADLGLWRSLARAAGGPVLDVGAGTGRVALDLAERGHTVTAVDLDPELLAVLAARARERHLEVETVACDARALDLRERRFGLCLVPMQTIQLLDGADGRRRFLERVREHVRPGGQLGVALVEHLDAFDAHEHGWLPSPDVARQDGWTFRSQPVAIRPARSAIVLERRREALGPAGQRATSRDRVILDRLDADGLEAEAAALGFEVLAAIEVPATAEHTSSRVVMLRRADG